ncbi:hypothetical protein BDQ12DRAFT_720054 [Crucibulum laeve]|uniref:Uncharacterized protein n=1 Tax=Crucibulum laeve TaxID=68775 RepID=A0A5C3MAX0_9AGAR|nr:hypothetical protein BDQ12DRAFT_720054 [Crucibulum laeve]
MTAPMQGLDATAKDFSSLPTRSPIEYYATSLSRPSSKSSVSTDGKSARDIITALKIPILRAFEAYESHRLVLQKFCDAEIPHRKYWDIDDIDSTTQLYNTFSGADRELNNRKSTQLTRMAELMNKNPGMLKLVGDVSQEKRLNEQHVINHFLQLSKKVTLPKMVQGKAFASYIFARKRFPLVPYDQYLRMMLKVLYAFPEYKYPDELTHVLGSMAYARIRSQLSTSFNSSDNTDVYLRTRYTPYSDDAVNTRAGRARGLKQPQFDTKGALDLFVEYNDRITPHDEREFEWLESFIKVCRFMSEMKDVEWKGKPGVSVAEYWEVHTAG